MQCWLGLLAANDKQASQLPPPPLLFGRSRRERLSKRNLEKGRDGKREETIENQALFVSALSATLTIRALRKMAHNTNLTG